MVHHPTSDYRLLEVRGHPVYVSPEAAASAKLLEAVLARLDANLKTVHETLPSPAGKALAKLPFWIERDNPDVPGMTYHPSAAWLSAHGYNPDKARCVEIGKLENFLDWQKIQPSMTLHEMSHAFHDQRLGFDHMTVKWAFDLAVASHRYESVPYAAGAPRKAYALTNVQEYFAELSEAYFERNDFYPFVRSELQTFDPAGFQMIEKMWFDR